MAGGVVALATALAVGTVASGAGSAAADPPSVLLTGVTSRAGIDMVSVLIEASEPAAYVATRPDPLTVLVDLRHARAEGTANRVVPGPGSVLHRVTIEEATSSDGAELARVRLSLLRPVPHTVRADRNVIRVEFASGAGEADASSAAAIQSPPAGTTNRPSSARVIQSVSKSAEPGALNITLKGDGPLMPATSQVLKDLPPRLVLDFSDVDTTAPATTPINQGPVQRVRVARNSASPLVTRVVLDLARVTPFDLRPMPGGELIIRFPDGTPATSPIPMTAAPPVNRPMEAAPKPVPPPVAAPAAVPAQPLAVPAVKPAEPAPKPVPPPVAAPAAVPAPPSTVPAVKPAEPAPKPVTAPPAAVPPVPAAGVSAPRQATPAPPSLQGQGSLGQKQYTGHLVGFDFNGADLRTVIRAFAELSGLNIVIDTAVKGSVDVSLKDVPWDQAFDIILRTNKLGWTVDGTIVRIAPLSVLADEEKELRKLAEEQALSGELKVLTRALSYAKADEVVELVKSSALSNRSSAVVDKRTNTIIISDLPAYLEKATALLNTLDQPELQVEIEAKIVQTTRELARQIGLKWGFFGQMTPELGNTTGLAYPNSVKGGAGIDLTLPGTPMGAVQLATGAINGAFNLDVALQALETDQKLKVLLTPRVTTQNNVKAIMTRGEEIPYITLTVPPGSGSVVSTMIPTVQFKTAALKLEVTPRITPSGTVLMDVDVDNGSPGQPQLNGNVSINTQRAQTRVIVKDGATTVIGGIYTTRDRRQDGRVPLMARIPLLGWLFRNSDIETTDEELLIFITPRIVKVQ